MSDKKGSNILILKNTKTPLEKKIRGGANLLKNIIKLKKNNKDDQKMRILKKKPKEKKEVSAKMGKVMKMKKK